MTERKRAPSLRPRSGGTAPLRRRTCLMVLAGAVLAATSPAVRGATLMLSGPAGTSLRINGQDAGQFPLPEPLSLTPGRYQLSCELKGHAPYEQTVFLEDESDWLRVQVRLTPLSRRTAVLSNFLLAGLGQRYLGRPRTGWFFTAAEVGGLVAALAGQLSYQNHRDEYLLLMADYQDAFTGPEIGRLRKAAADEYQLLQDAESLRNLGLAVAAGAVVVSALDAWLRFPSFTAGAGPVPPDARVQTSSLPGAVWPAGEKMQEMAAVHVAWRLSF